MRRAVARLGQLCVALGLVVATCARASADRESGPTEREHTVRQGQTLSLIAARYGVKIAAIQAANDLPSGAKLRLGQVLVIPPRGVVYVRAGDTLGSIAKQNQVSTADLMRANDLQANSKLRIGQSLLLPGIGAKSAGAARSGGRWGAPKQRGVATLYRVATSERRRVRLVDTQGRVTSVTLRTLRDLLRPRGSRAGKNPNARLVRLLAKVSDYFGGREIQVISGYRRPGGFTRTTSRHVAGDAIDFRIPGVPLEDLRDYCAKLGQVGVGFYPTGQFVHLDVRKTNAHWTDWSGPGEAPQLVPPLPSGEDGEESATAQAALDEGPSDARPVEEAEATAAITPPPRDPTAANSYALPPTIHGLIPR